MNEQSLNEVYTQVAKKYGISAEEVKRELEEIMHAAKNNPDP